MSFEGMLFIIWIVSSILTLMIFALDERIKPDNAIKTGVFAAIPIVNTVFMIRMVISWFKND